MGLMDPTSRQGFDPSELQMMGTKRKAAALEDCFAGAPEVLATDAPAVAAALQLHTINIEPWLMSLSLDDLRDLKKTLEQGSRTGSLDYITNTNLEYVSELKKVKAPDTRHETRVRE